MPAKRVNSFNFITTKQAQVLILGSMPGVASLQAQKYYGHPRNAFWPIMSELLLFDFNTPYEQRLRFLQQANLALWDVLATCRRQGSLDSAIESNSIQLNDFEQLFSVSPDIQHIVFNGQTAYKLFRGHNCIDFPDKQLHIFPSTSPAYASMHFTDKLKHWEKIKTFLL